MRCYTHVLDLSSLPPKFIRSIDRRNLNEVLLTEAERYPNVHLHFEHKLKSFDVKKNELVFERWGGGVLD